MVTSRPIEDARWRRSPPEEPLARVQRSLHEAFLELARLGECHAHAELLAGAARLHGQPSCDETGEAGAALAELRRTERLLADARRRVAELVEALDRLAAPEPATC